MATPEQDTISVNILPLIEAAKHLQAALQFIRTQPSAGPLIAVQVNTLSAMCVLNTALAEIKAAQPAIMTQPKGLVVPNGVSGNGN